MLFTVVESRDGRLVAESIDRQTKLTLEGGPAAHGYTVGQKCWLSLLGQEAPAVVAQSNGPAASGLAAVEQELVEAGEPPLVSTDLSDEAVLPLAKRAKRK